MLIMKFFFMKPAETRTVGTMMDAAVRDLDLDALHVRRRNHGMLLPLLFFHPAEKRYDAVADPGERLQLVDHRAPQILVIAGGVFQRLGQFVDVG